LKFTQQCFWAIMQCWLVVTDNMEKLGLPSFLAQSKEKRLLGTNGYIMEGENNHDEGHNEYQVQSCGKEGSQRNWSNKEGRRTHRRNFEVVGGSQYKRRWMICAPQQIFGCSIQRERETKSVSVKKFPAHYSIWRFITVFTTTHHLPLSRATVIHSTHTHHTISSEHEG